MNFIGKNTKTVIFSVVILLTSPFAHAEDAKKFDFGFNKIFSKDIFYWDNNFKEKLESAAAQEKTKASNKSSLVERIAASTASLLVEFTSHETFNNIEVN